MDTNTFNAYQNEDLGKSQPEQNGITTNRTETKSVYSIRNEKMAADERKMVYQCYTGTALFKALSPLFTSLKICGLFHSKQYQWPYAKCEPNVITDGNLYRPTFFASQAYAWIVLILS